MTEQEAVVQEVSSVNINDDGKDKEEEKTKTDIVEETKVDPTPAPAPEPIPTSDYVVVQDPSNEESIEVPTSENAVLMSTLQATFPGATGLKYKNPKTGANRVVQVDPTGIKLLAPADGWDDKVFSVILPPQSERVRAVSSADVSSAKRRKVVDSNGDDSDSDDERDGRSGRKRAVQSSEREGPVDLIVLGVDFKTTEETFRKYFEKIGSVVFCEIKKKPTGGSKGFGFVRMATTEEQNKVVAIPQHIIDGRRCDVKVPEAKTERGRPAVSRIFVGRITDAITEDALRRRFGEEAKRAVESATVTDVYIPKPFRGFAFVTLSNGKAAEDLVRKGSISVDGVATSLSIAQPREEATSGPDYGLPAGYRRRTAERRPLLNNYDTNDYARAGYWGSAPDTHRMW